MKERSLSSVSAYRYGFNGKELDKNIQESDYDYGMRIYDPRIGRFLSVDPLLKRYPFYSPYQFAGNTPIVAIDEDGMEPVGSTGYGGAGFMYKSMTDKGRFVKEINGKVVDGTLFRVVDAKNVSFWVIEETKVEFYQDDWLGLTPVIKKDYYYFTKPPSTCLDDYAGGEWLPYETENEIARKQGSEVANGIGIGAFILLSSPFAIYAAVESGPLLWKGWSNPYFQYFLLGDIGGAYAYEYGSGSIGVSEEISIASSSSPSTQNSKPNTQQLAKEAHALLDPIAQGKKTTAIGIDEDGVLYISSSDKTVPKLQRDWAESKGIVVVNGDGHAEETLMKNEKIVHIDASRGICVDCENQMQKQNVSTNTNTTGKKSKNRQ